MICATFIFQQHTNDADFAELDDEIMAAANAQPGFIKKDKWLSPDGKTIRVDYYFEGRNALAEFSANARHKEAKARYQDWYVGFEVQIAEIKGNKSDGNLNR